MPGLELAIAADAELDEPMWCYMKSDRESIGVGEVTGVVIGCPFVKAGSVTSLMADRGVIGVRSGGSTCWSWSLTGAEGDGTRFSTGVAGGCLDLDDVPKGRLPTPAAGCQPAPH